MRHDHPYADANLRNQLFDLLLHNMQTTQSGEQGTEIAAGNCKSNAGMQVLYSGCPCFKMLPEMFTLWILSIWFNDIRAGLLLHSLTWDSHIATNTGPWGVLMLNDRMLQPGLTTQLGWKWTSANLETPKKHGTHDVDDWHPWCGSNHSKRSFSENTFEEHHAIIIFKNHPEIIHFTIWISYPYLYTMKWIEMASFNKLYQQQQHLKLLPNLQLHIIMKHWTI